MFIVWLQFQKLFLIWQGNLFFSYECVCKFRLVSVKYVSNQYNITLIYTLKLLSLGEGELFPGFSR